MNAPNLSWFAILRLAIVQACLGGIVVLTTSTLNRIMVVELALPAIIPGALVAWHYAVQFLRPRMGFAADQGYRITYWILGGMAVLAIGGFLAAVATVWMMTDRTAGLLLAILAFSLIGIGVSCSGTSLLVLLAKYVDDQRRAPAATLVWVTMIAGFVITAAISGKLLDPYTPQRLLLISASVSVIAFCIACLAIWGVEPVKQTFAQLVPHINTLGNAQEAIPETAHGAFQAPSRSLSQDATSHFSQQASSQFSQEASNQFSQQASSQFSQQASNQFSQEASNQFSQVTPAPKKLNFFEQLKLVWSEPAARQFTVFIFLSMFAYNAQDLILEPFAGIVYGFTPGQTTSLSGLQHAGVLSGMILVAIVCSTFGKKWLGATVSDLSLWTVCGCIASGLAMIGLVFATQSGGQWPLRGNVFLLGVANGAFSIAAISSMMKLAREGQAGREGTRMGLWGAAQAIAFGLGGIVGAGLSDVARVLLNSTSSAYGAVFFLEFVLFFGAAWIAAKMNRPNAVSQSNLVGLPKQSFSTNSTNVVESR
jgi:MFS transporter, BCD family, chlorophyll transporter